MIFTRFDRYVDRHARAFTERLQEICRMPSVAARGTGMRAMAEAIEKLMQRSGAGTRRRTPNSLASAWRWEKEARCSRPAAGFAGSPNRSAIGAATAGVPPERIIPVASVSIGG